MAARRGEEQGRLRAHRGQPLLERRPQRLDLGGRPVRAHLERATVPEHDERDGRERRGAEQPELAGADVLVGQVLAVGDGPPLGDERGRQHRLEPAVPLGCDRVHEHHARRLVRIAPRVQLGVEAAERRPDEHVRRGQPGGAEQRVQVVDGARGAVGRRPEVARPEAGPVVRADRGELGHPHRDRRPDVHLVAQSRVEHDHRRTGSPAGDVEVPSATDVDAPVERRRTRRWGGGAGSARSARARRRRDRRPTGRDDDRDQGEDGAPQARRARGTAMRQVHAPRRSPGVDRFPPARGPVRRGQPIGVSQLRYSGRLPRTASK